MSTKTEIDIYNYRADFTRLERLRYILAIVDAFNAGQPLEVVNLKSLWVDDGNWEVPIPGTDENNILANFREGYLAYRVARPKIAEGHNPDRLTEDQVGVKDGWRLLTMEELVESERIWKEPKLASGNREQFYQNGVWRPGLCRTDGLTYRTMKPKGYYLPKPAKLVPWTFETAPKGIVLIRGNGSPDWIAPIVTWRLHGVLISSYGSHSWAGLLAHYEHSLDGGKTWAKCGTMEGEK